MTTRLTCVQLPLLVSCHLNTCKLATLKTTLVSFLDEWWIHTSYDYGPVEDLYKWWEEDVGARMCKLVTNAGPTANCHTCVLHLFPIFFLVRQVHLQIMLPVCGWKKKKWAGIASPLTPPQIRREAGRGSDTDTQTERIERGQRERESEAEGRVKETEDIFDCVGVWSIKACIIIVDSSWSSWTSQCIRRRFTGLPNCVILYFKTVEAESTDSDILKDKMETDLFLLPRGFH